MLGGEPAIKNLGRAWGGVAVVFNWWQVPPFDCRASLDWCYRDLVQIWFTLDTGNVQQPKKAIGMSVVISTFNPLCLAAPREVVSIQIIDPHGCLYGASCNSSLSPLS